MLKFFDLLSSPIRKNSLFFTLIFTLFTTPIFISIFTSLLGINHIIEYNIPKRAILISFCYSYLFSLISNCLHKYTDIKTTFNIIIISILSILNIIESFLAFHFKMGINPLAVTLMLQTNQHESQEFISTYIFNSALIIPIISFILIVFAIITVLNIFKKIISKSNSKAISIFKTATSIIVIVLLLSTTSQLSYLYKLIVAKSTYEISLASFNFPQDVISKTIYSLKSTFLSNKDITHLANNIKNIRIDSCSYTSPKIVLILGESFNKHHSNLYGYTLNTNPLLTKRKNDGNLFIFSDVITPFNSTSATMQALTSTESSEPDKNWVNKPLFPCILKKSGYITFWLDNQMINNKKDNDLQNYLCSYFINHPQIDSAAFDIRNNKLFEFDLDLLSEWEKAKNLQSEHNFIFFHLWGQHIAANKRFPNTTEYQYFNIDSIKRPDLSNTMKQQVADYDNATRYNDIVVDSIISLFEQDDAIIIYISDHGDEVNDYRPHIGRSHEFPPTRDQIINQFEVPMMIWCSDTYKQNHPKIIQQIRSSLNNSYSIDDISHLILDLAGIKSPHFDPTRSIINPNFKQRKRHILQSQFTYEQIML